MHSGARRLSIRSCSTEKRPISWGRHPRAPDTGGLHSAGPAQFRPRPPSVPSVVPSADGRLCPASSRGLLSVQVPSWCRLLLLEGRLSLWWRTPPAPCCSALIPSLKVPSPHTFGHWGEGFQHKPLGFFFLLQFLFCKIWQIHTFLFSLPHLKVGSLSIFISP